MSDENVIETTPEPTLPSEPLESIVSRVWGESSTEVPETPAEAPVTPPAAEEPKVLAAQSQRILESRAAERRARAEREQLAATRAEVDAKRAELAELAKIAEQVKAAKLSPSKALELLGTDAKAFLEGLAGEHEPAAIAAREVESVRQEVAAARKELAELRESQQAEKQAIEKQRNAELMDKAQAEFVEHVAKNHEKYPTLIEHYTPREIIAEGLNVCDQIVGHDERGRPVTRYQAFLQENGRGPTDDEIAEYLESTIAPVRAKERNEWRARYGQPAPTLSASTQPGQTAAAQPDKGPSPRTLTARETSVRASASKPWSQEAADEESLRILRSARAAVR